MQVKRTGILIKPNPRRVFFRPFNPSGEGRIMKVLARIMTIPEEEVEPQLQQVLAEVEQLADEGEQDDHFEDLAHLHQQSCAELDLPWPPPPLAD